MCHLEFKCVMVTEAGQLIFYIVARAEQCFFIADCGQVGHMSNLEANKLLRNNYTPNKDEAEYT